MALEGRLADMSLVDLFQVFSMGSKTGKLIVKQSPDIHGIIWIIDGAITNAVVTDLKKYFHLSGEQAVSELLQWEDADFHFNTLAPEESYQKIISATNESLILQGMRRREQGESPTIYPHISLDTNIRLVADLVEPDISQLTAEEAGLFNYMKTHRYAIVREVTAGNYFSVEKVFAIISRLLALRLIEIDSNNTIPARVLRADKIMPAYQREFITSPLSPLPEPQPALVGVGAASATGAMTNHVSSSSPFVTAPSLSSLTLSPAPYSAPSSTYSPFQPPVQPVQLEPQVQQPAATGLRGLLRSIKSRLLRGA